ncbi:MAG: tRNA (adenosine(37)-N6)-dimethylallyltransferase MiaA [Bacteroidetes bacterium]|nr:tRNA (adenosine(37)-N6)-dimethylallyltransferase MiaA [Bacteroidota bacterium]
MHPAKYLVVIAGPTGVGKTALAIELASHFDSVIVSADSRQFYRELEIGTAKPSPEQLQRVTHYFINNKSVTELYGAGHYEKDAIELLDRLFNDHDIVFLVGGSGLYIDAVLNGVDEFIDVAPEIREQLNRELESEGLTFLREKLKELDPDYYAKVDLYNSQRIIRALEVCIHSGKPFSSFLKKENINRNFIPIKILVNLAREKLYAQINSRVEEMMEKGLLDEVKRLSPYKHLNGLKTVGYKEMYAYLDHSYSLETAVIKVKQHTRNYAKRQLTWFKNQDEFEEFAPADIEKIKAYIDLIRSHA